jgi:phosphohistidine phosphatase
MPMQGYDERTSRENAPPVLVRGRHRTLPQPIIESGERFFIAWRCAMKTLFLVRHAKSSRDDPTLADKERPLNDRGRRDAPRMGERLAKHDVKPDLILSSPAVRALATAETIAKRLDYKIKNIIVDERLYAAASEDVLEVIRELGEKSKRVMLFGHNPALAELAHRLSSTIADMATCAVAEFAFNIKSWADVGKRAPAKVVQHHPKRS